ncbi:type VI secretion system membrane subunit TssM [Acetobacter sp. TBRC 12305]|uniref:Type VI secretion system membrane subunit TssM n=1 Tax=Acetobacter garciniae TaxID=2817435 RepID=A0A939KR90_9PROT|nr:type VI secretion system membrane subunit TssM [Acetobacter garciniae]MBO1326502.1 type VI secretion system membrane subunit TssM [Acetobacter garciniae]MBX0346182.1 type VI secretion system membrane subunit TssM [Acetobacter garciniae]
MSKIVAILTARWFLSGVATAVLGTLLWFFGPFLSVLAPIWPRLAGVVLLLGLWAGINLAIDWRRRMRDAALAQGVAHGGTPDSATDQAAANEAAVLAERLKSALAVLRKARGRGSYLYEQPWYVIIGPPGSGKTTALLNAGLTFPLNESAIAGVGGTRLCDWWFADQAVLIDTAGRYTTQDTGNGTDRAGWDTFLDLLRNTRKRQALNGVMVAFSLADLAGMTASERSAHAQAIRRRIREMTERLGLKLPVYMLLTKADLLAGFSEFYDDLDEERRAQVWGMTFDPAATNPIGTLDSEFSLLCQRLDDRLIDLLQRERSPDKRVQIAAFPSQFASLHAPLTGFLTEAFGASLLDPAPFLRGVYFTSGTQEGTPFDRLTGALARSYGIDQARASSLRPVKGRSYFLRRLLCDVMFGEAMLASMSPARRRRRMVLLGGGYAAVAAAFMLILVGLLISRARNADAIERSNTALRAYERVAGGLPLDPVRDTDVMAVLPLLDAARALPFGPDDRVTGLAGMGLSQAGKLAAGAQATYVHALDHALLPRIVLQLEAEMRGSFDRPEFLYQVTRVYLMLGGQGPMDRTLVKTWMKLDWERLYPGPARARQRADLQRHLDALLASSLPPVPLDGTLVDAARTTFAHVSPAQRIYSRIRDSAPATLPPWVPAQEMGAAGVPLFSRASGRPLTEGIPGFYTLKGFRTVMLPALAHVTRDVTDESWVLGPQMTADAASPEVAGLESNVLALYSKDYEAHWDAMLADLNLKPATNAAQAAQNLYVLSSPQSPMARLLNSAITQMQLSAQPTAPSAGPVQAIAQAGAAVANANSAEAALKGLMAPTGADSEAALPGSDVATYYAPLMTYVGTGTGAPLSLTLNLITNLHQQMAALMAPSGGAGSSLQGGDAASLLAGEAATAPAPVNRWLSSLTRNVNDLRGGSAARAAGTAFNGAGGPAQLCQQAVAGRYPFTASSSADIPLGDFARLFAPNGQLDSFFSQQVQPFIDMSQSVWRVQAVNGVAPPIGQGALAAFQRAQTIKQAFFASGMQPAVQFTLTPLSLSADATQAVLQLGGLSVTYAQGPQMATTVSWPGNDGMQTARLTLTLAGGGAPLQLTATGPWALFHLFGQGRMTPAGGPDRYTLSFDIGGHTVSYTLGATSVLNPFVPGLLSSFHCPAL